MSRIELVRSLSVALLALPSLAGCSSVVGGACVPGTIVCEGACVDPRTDESACGGCGQACAAGAMCVESRCIELGGDVGAGDGGPDDAGGTDAGVPDGGHGLWDTGDGPQALDGGGVDGGVMSDVGDEPSDAAIADAGPFGDGGPPGDGGAPDDGGAPGDAGPLACELGTTACDGVCVDLATDVTSCGACGVRCGPAQLCAAGVCVDRCGPGTLECGSACIDPMTDPDNCGRCGHECPSGICTLGVCTGALAGHLVAIGHDYVTHRAAMDRLLANAVLLAGRSPARVLTYVGLADPASVTGAESAIRSTALAMGRELDWQRATDGELVSSELRDADVFLIHAQAAGSDEGLALLGASWSRALATFLERGGVVVMLDAPADHRGTFGILEAAALMTSSGLTEITLDTVDVVAPWDGVAIGIPLTYRAELSSVRFDDADLPVVVRDASGGAVVLHRTVVP